jgi:hypothetical protein
MTRLTLDNTNASGISIDLTDEREVTKQCLRICEEARSYIESLTDRASPLLQEAPQNASEDDIRNFFEAQLLTRQALDENRDKFAAIIGHLQNRLESQVLEKDHTNDKERLQLQEDIEISRQCLEVCKVANEVSSKKIYRVGEVIATGDSDQVVVTTLADLFDVRKALAQDNAMQLVGSMAADSLRHLAEQRYTSRFGASTRSSDPAKAGTTGSPPVLETQKGRHAFPAENDGQPPESKARQNRPSSNETRKRATYDAMD